MTRHLRAFCVFALLGLLWGGLIAVIVRGAIRGFRESEFPAKWAAARAKGATAKPLEMPSR
jgi:hypothetical protein